MILVKNLSKTFKVHKKEAGLKASLKSLIKRKYRVVEALKDISLEINKGELVGMVGSNGAGKTTLTKILSGIICPSGGEVTVNGFIPFKKEIDYKLQMSLIMGQKNQLWWDLPAEDCFVLLKEIYGIDEVSYKKRLAELSEVLEVKELLGIQVRRLSLGERMKMELIAALLHQPKVVFLDEPTIGLDISAQKAVRKFLLYYKEQHKPIMILTSHYMKDIASLCERVVVIKKGELVYDGGLNSLKSEYANTRKVTAIIKSERDVDFSPSLKYEFNKDSKELVAHVDKADLPNFLANLSASYEFDDLEIGSEDLELIIERVMRGN